MTDRIDESGDKALVLIEWHDARVHDVTLGASGRVSVNFDHLAVYRELGPELYEVWSYTAKLQIEGTTGCRMAGNWAEREFVDDVSLEPLADRSAGELMNGISLRAFRLKFTGGCIVEFDCLELRLELLRAVKKIKDWQGPLFTNEANNVP